MATEADKSIVANAIIPSIAQYLVMHPEITLSKNSFGDIVKGIEEERLLEAYATFQFVSAPKELETKYKMIKFVNKSRSKGSKVGNFFTYFDQYKSQFSIVPNGNILLDAAPQLAKIDGKYFMKIYSALQNIGEFMGDFEGKKIVEKMFDSTHRGESSYGSEWADSPMMGGVSPLPAPASPRDIADEPEYQRVVAERNLARKEFESLKTRFKELEATATRLQEENREFGEEKKQVEDLLEEERKKTKTAKKILETSEEAKTKEIRILREKIAEAEGLNEQLDEQRTAAEIRIAELEKLISARQTELSKKDAKIRELTDENEKLKMDVAEKVSELEEEKRLKNEEIARVDELTKKNDVLEESLKKEKEGVREKMASAKEVNDKLVEEKSALEEEVRQLKDTAARVKEVMDKNAGNLAKSTRNNSRLTRALKEARAKIETLESSSEK